MLQQEQEQGCDDCSCQRGLRVKVIFFRCNYGQTAAISVGFKYAHGGVIVTLDADLQNDPADTQKLLQKMSEGSVCCCRK